MVLKMLILLQKTEDILKIVGKGCKNNFDNLNLFLRTAETLIIINLLK